MRIVYISSPFDPEMYIAQSQHNFSTSLAKLSLRIIPENKLVVSSLHKRRPRQTNVPVAALPSLYHCHEKRKTILPGCHLPQVICLCDFEGCTRLIADACLLAGRQDTGLLSGILLSPHH